ncbi:N-acetyltransferase ESCO2 isoform X2 [Orussus abietinus]|uniref:N-acetyltransferase ESCO2 isoform X2 n=1 Tax=Orussus abietinus TaxID=222816 RepID=UPI0006250A3D|nr:N-acetyltransferase ESCO2 isoform X2 [Orussus abietinus]
MLSNDSGHCDSASTPRRVQKRLFVPGTSSSKKKLFQEDSPVNSDATSEDSDLGHMSPLAVTDQSPTSIGSSPGREFQSPVVTPSTTPRSRRSMSWDRLMPNVEQKCLETLSPFSALKRLTLVTRSSPRRKIILNSPKSGSLTTPTKANFDNSLSPLNNVAPLFATENQIPDIPQRHLGTPQKSSEPNSEVNMVSETPSKEESPLQRLITPLGSVSKVAPLPRLHRRKSTNVFDDNASSSPDQKENFLKRHTQDTLVTSTAKLLKSDDALMIPKARAALFQEKKEKESKIKEFTLSAKSFYNLSSKDPKRERTKSFVMQRKESERSYKRRSLPTNHRRSVKRRRLGEINAGVYHAIKKPKTKRNVPRTEACKKEKHSSPSKQLQNSSDDNEENSFRSKIPKLDNIPVLQRAPSPEVDPSKRFFKTNRTIKSNHVATVTVNNKIKLCVSDGKIVLNKKKKSRNNMLRKPKINDLSFDASDLTVDEPENEARVKHNNVADILKILEDDWADDDYDKMGTLTASEVAVSPKKSTINLEDIMMSPASELSNMTSVMNIKDPCSVNANQIINGKESDGKEKMHKENTIKYYPLFEKGYSGQHFDDDNSNKKSRGLKRPAHWETLMKCGAANDQYQLDAGQKRFGETQCTECGIVYQLGDPEDENSHLNYHNSLKTMNFNGWKKERVVFEDPFTASKIILIEPNDPVHCWKKVTEVLGVIDRELGLLLLEI